MNKKDIHAKQSLVKATDAIRNKFREIRSSDLESKRLLEKHYKPITKRLGSLISFQETKAKKKK